MPILNRPKAGEKAPAFKGTRDGGETLALADLKGKAVVLYFYPKDDTPGCTKQAIEFTSMVDEFDAAGAMIVGVSRDPVKKHDKFRDKHDLNVALISDEDGAITEAYGVWVEKSMYGKTFMGIERATFLIDAAGKIVRVWDKVKVAGHVAEVLDATKKLTDA
jgi:peroxiredoxin Q/BCP